jgi:arylsulfatase A-like enzyme
MQKAPRALLACAAALAAVAGCDGSTPQGPVRNLIVISIDTLRPDRLGLYGYERPTSPALDAFATRGVVFELALTPAPWTLPAHASLLTGLYPRRHGVRTHQNDLPVAISTLAQQLQQVGYRTASIHNTHHLDTRYGLHRGFDHLDYVRESVGRERPAEVYLRALEWLAQAPEPFFLLLHTFDVHSDYRSLRPYEAMFTRAPGGRVDGSTEQLIAFRRGLKPLDAKDAQDLEDLYVAGIRQMDEALKPVLALLEHTDLGERTFVWITSDHGEEFLEHGGVLHGRTQFEELLRVPLLLSGPGLPANRRIEEPVSLIDVLPTTRALLGLPPLEDLDGRDLVPLLRGADPEPFRERVLFGESDHHNLEAHITRSARYRNFKLVHDLRSGRSQLYDLAADPGEQLDVREEHPEIAEMLRSGLEQLEASQARVPDRRLPELDPAEVERLRALGYAP